jgi:hypothetical protein
VIDDMAAAGHIFGYAALGLNYFQVLGAIAFGLVTVLQVRRWWDG